METVNYGGFVPLSTVDWHGRMCCTVFFRGCPCRCLGCHNQNLQDSYEKCTMPVETIVGKIKEASPLISGAVFSGGEPCMQPSELIALLKACRDMGLKTCIHTSGVCSKNLYYVLMTGLVDHVCLDLKTALDTDAYEIWTSLPGAKEQVETSLSTLKNSKTICKIGSYELITTCFDRCRFENVNQLSRILPSVPDTVKYVLQQGNLGGMPTITGEVLTRIAKGLGRENTYVRTREFGEVQVA